ncbi:MAG: SEL1-like repeat protein, partial [Bacteroidales bacterium]|nr:SEL1-like repeat protein [Bacteroidales bacterium]
ARAQNNLGVCYEKGQGVKKDYNKAKEWFSKAAEQGNEKAKTNLKRVNDLLSNDLPF